MDTPLTLRGLSLLGFVVDSGDQNYWTVQTPDDETALFCPHFIDDRATKQDVLRAQKKANRINKEYIGKGGKLSDLLLRSKEEIIPLILAPNATPGTEQAALDGEVSLFTTSPYRLIHHQKTWGEPTPEVSSPRKQITWTQGAIIRLSILSPETLTQLEIADILGLSQPAIAKAAKSLEKKYGFSLEPHRRPLPHALLSFLEKNYPPHVSIRTYWRDSQPILGQAQQAIAAYSRHQLWPLITGEVAADHYAAWKLPETAELYAEGPLDLENYGFLEVDPEAATLQIKITKDPTILATAHWWAEYTHQDRLLYVDPVTAFIDMQRSALSDAREGAQKLLTFLSRKEN